MVIDTAASTLFCLQKPLEEAVPDLLAAGTKCIEIVDDGPHALTRSRVEKLRELQSSHDLKYSLHAPFVDVNIAATDASLRQATLRRLRDSVSWASTLRAEALVLHPGSKSVMEQFTPGAAWRTNIEPLRSILNFAQDLGVPTMIENLPEPYPFLMKSVEDFERFYAESGLDVRMVLDVAHASLRGETLAFIGRLGERIGHIHVSDNGGGMDEHLKLGEGSIDWVEAVEAIKSISFSGWVVVESFKGIQESLALLQRILN